MNDVKITVIKGTSIERFFQTVSFYVLIVVTVYGAAKGGTLAQLALGGSLLPTILAAFWKMARFRLHRWTGKAFKIPASTGGPPEYAFIAEKIRHSRWLPFSCLLKAFIFRMVVAESVSGSTVVVDRTVGEFKRLEGLVKPIGRWDTLEGDAAVNFSDRLKELEGECSVERSGMLEMLASGLIVKPGQANEVIACTVESDIVSELTEKYTKLLEQINELSRRYTKFEKSRPTKVSTARDQIRAELSGEISELKEQLKEVAGRFAEVSDIESMDERMSAGKEDSND